jgi:hypothetical protein
MDRNDRSWEKEFQQTFLYTANKKIIWLYKQVHTYETKPTIRLK